MSVCKWKAETREGRNNLIFPTCLIAIWNAEWSQESDQSKNFTKTAILNEIWECTLKCKQWKYGILN